MRAMWRGVAEHPPKISWRPGRSGGKPQVKAAANVIQEQSCKSFFLAFAGERSERRSSQGENLASRARSPLARSSQIVFPPPRTILSNCLRSPFRLPDLGDEFEVAQRPLLHALKMKSTIYLFFFFSLRPDRLKLSVVSRSRQVT